MARKSDLVDVVASAYRLDCDDQTWLDGLVDVVGPILDRGLGVYGFQFDASDPSAFRIWGMANPGGALVAEKLVLRWHEALGPKLIHRMYSSGQQYALISDRLGLGPDGADHPAMTRFCRGLGVFDQLTLRGVDPTRRGVTLCTPIGRTDGEAERPSRVWTLAAAHIASGYRLRRRLFANASEGQLPDPKDGADAVFTPDGRTLHAEGAAASRRAREALRDGVRAMDRARSTLKRESDVAALDIWRGLVEGTWSVVEHFDSDGRRMILARRNVPDVPDPQTLTERERQTVGYYVIGHRPKEIAYALGLSPASVETYLTSAMRKLKVKSRAELLQLFWTRATGPAKSHE